jgi:hypothetical protein
MNTYGTLAASRRPSGHRFRPPFRRPGPGKLRLLLLSIAIGFGVSFGGSLLLADQITASSAGAPSEAEIAQVSGGDWTVLSPAPKAPSTTGDVEQPDPNQRPIRRDELGTDEQIHRIYVCTVHAQPDPASELPEHVWACVDTSDDG